MYVFLSIYPTTSPRILYVCLLIIRQIGEKKHNEYTVTFKQLFDDDEVANTLESLAGTLKVGSE
jgi:hypothetical protein